MKFTVYWLLSCCQLEGLCTELAETGCKKEFKSRVISHRNFYFVPLFKRFFFFPHIEESMYMA